MLVAVATLALADRSDARPRLHGEKLRVDRDLSRRAEDLLARSRAHEGAIVMSDVRTGRVLVWASRGESDFVSRPFAPSASLFKVVTASALLESGEVDLDTEQCFSGGEGGIEPIDLLEDRSRDRECARFGDALGRSINLVIARLALRHLSPDQLRAAAADLALGTTVPIDLDVPKSDLTIPDDPLGFARASAGFWNGHLSALSALFVMQTIANGGERIALDAVDDGQPEERRSLGQAMSASTARKLTRMLEVTTRSGTSAKAFGEDANGERWHFGRVAGKTGTLVGGKPSRMYSWFAGFAPSRRPEVAISVMLGDDLHWWKKANVVAREMLAAYFEAQAER